ncbi:hypothetical protein CHARACLAT_019986 [Characodon lateralis]|uniref:Uncharacterized protein n=1 Tax=Characodon lateralis TaxID=208331 RepID=A0ABU7EXX1_9TELE|nr:hypothetical protein [Characodon lateralis]
MREYEELFLQGLFPQKWLTYTCRFSDLPVLLELSAFKVNRENGEAARHHQSSKVRSCESHILREELTLKGEGLM